MNVRKMEDKDLNDVIAIEHHATEFPWSRKNFEDSLKANNHAWVFIDEKGEIEAFTLIQKVFDETHLLNICVSVKSQGKGVGKHVLNFVIEHANSISSTIVLLEVRRSNTRAQNMYYSAGFNEMSVRKNYYPAKEGREDAVLMGLDLGLASLFSLS